MAWKAVSLTEVTGYLASTIQLSFGPQPIERFPDLPDAPRHKSPKSNFFNSQCYC